MPKLRSSLPNEWNLGDVLEVLVELPATNKTIVCLFHVVSPNKLRLEDADIVPVEPEAKDQTTS